MEHLAALLEVEKKPSEVGQVPSDKDWELVPGDWSANQIDPEVVLLLPRYRVEINPSPGQLEPYPRI